jgi:hypothetical protein
MKSGSGGGRDILCKHHSHAEMRGVGATLRIMKNNLKYQEGKGEKTKH